MPNLHLIPVTETYPNEFYCSTIPIHTPYTLKQKNEIIVSKYIKYTGSKMSSMFGDATTTSSPADGWVVISFAEFTRIYNNYIFKKHNSFEDYLEFSGKWSPVYEYVAIRFY